MWIPLTNTCIQACVSDVGPTVGVFMYYDTPHVFANAFVFVVGLLIIYRGLTSKRFYRVRHGYRSEPREQIEPRWYHRVFLVAMGTWVAGFGLWHLFTSH